MENDIEKVVNEWFKEWRENSENDDYPTLLRSAYGRFADESFEYKLNILLPNCKFSFSKGEWILIN